MKTPLTRYGLVFVAAIALAGCAPAVSAPTTSAPAPTIPPATSAPIPTIAPVATAAPIAPTATRALQTPKKLTWAFALGTNCLDPAFQTGSPDSNNMLNIYDSVVSHHNDTLRDVSPGLAEKWEISPDGLTYTFHLRSGAKWQGGYGEVTAQDVKYSWDRMLDPATKASGGAVLRVIKTVDAVDPKTVRVTLKNPTPPFLVNIAHDPGSVIVNKKAIDERGKEYCLKPIGSGPYQVVKAQTNGGITMQAFADGWRGKPAIDEVELRVIPDESVAVLAFKGGDIDYMVPREPINITALRKTQGVVVNGDEKASASIYALWLNDTRKPFDDPRVRKALAQAIDRKTMVSSVTEGMLSVVANSIVPPTLLGYTDDVTKYPYDLEAAKAALKDAGYEKGFDVTAEAIQTSDNPAMLTVVQSMWKKVGVNLNISFLDRASIRAHQANGNFDITISNPTRAEVDGIMDFFRCQNIPGSNYAQYRSACALIDQQAQEPDVQKRIALLQQIQKMIAQDLPVIPLWYPVEVTAARSYVKGMVLNLGGWQTRFYLMDIQK